MDSAMMVLREIGGGHGVAFHSRQARGMVLVSSGGLVNPLVRVECVQGWDVKGSDAVGAAVWWQYHRMPVQVGCGWSQCAQNLA